MNNDKLKLIESLLRDEPSEFRSAFTSLVEARKLEMEKNRKSIIASTLLEEPEDEDEDKEDDVHQEPKKEKETPKPAQEAKPEKTEDSAEVALDPGMEKEFFVKAFEEGGKRVTLKTLGTGKTAPIVVYVDEKRWEIFTGPKAAEKAVKEYIGTMDVETKNEVEVSKEEYFYAVIDRALNEHNSNFTSANGEKVYLTREQAKLIVKLHDSLSEENQALLRERVIINKDSLKSVVKFAKKAGDKL
tara:strand:- start:68 stop:799 length:732 start_codon:yes stop_codon:yes gene_type:complete